jgi:hypothetical protein
MLAFANMVYFFTDELPRLGARRLAFAGVFSGSFNGFSFRHMQNPPFLA